MRTSTLPLLAALCLGGPALADPDWVSLSGEDLRATLAGRTVVYEFEKQEFFESGRTSYDAGILDWGHWEVREDRYCSLWPPAEDWSCYTVDLRSFAGMEQVRFTGEDGVAITGSLLE